MARGNGRAAIFRSDADRTLFLKTLGKAAGRSGRRVHGWVLLEEELQTEIRQSDSKNSGGKPIRAFAAAKATCHSSSTGSCSGRRDSRSPRLRRAEQSQWLVD